MPAVFPVQARIGYGGAVEYREHQRVYDDLSYRVNRRSTAAHEKRSLSLTNISQAQFDAVKAFFKARKSAAASDYAFYVYDPDAVSSIDLTGSSATGRHTAIFTDPEMQYTRVGRCRYSLTLNVLFLD